ncbi:MAG: hypothetical protein JNG90_09595 [Planctomycetaceae bacterium]|nr:hypothetical protein [Planctomycetaceae bacterium]
MRAFFLRKQLWAHLLLVTWGGSDSRVAMHDPAATPPLLSDLNASPAPGATNGRWIWGLRAALVVVTLWLAIGGLLRHPRLTPVDVSLWQNIEGSRATQIAHRLLVEFGTPALGFLVAGALTAAVVDSTWPRLRRRQRWGLIVILGATLCGLVRTAQLWHLPAPGHLVGPLLLLLSGAWVGPDLAGQSWRGCLRSFAWRAGQIALVAVVALMVLAGIGWLSLDRKPFAFESLAVNNSDLRVLGNTLRGHRESVDDARRVELSSADLDLALAAAVTRIAPGSKGRVQLDGDLARIEISLALPGGNAPRYLNLAISGQATIDQGELALRPEQVAIGRLNVPRVVLRLVAPPLASALQHDSELRNLVSAIDVLAVEQGQLRVVFRPGECSDTFVPALAHLVSGRPKVTVEVREHASNLLSDAATLPPGDARFAALLQRAFAFARRRSRDGDPVLENRAALLALAILVGDERVEKVVGPVLTPEQRELARRDLAGVTLRGRSDWTKHFFVSAAIALLACEVTSNKIGTLKEVLDAEAGGSGFSFGDFAANRGGIRLALAATDDRQAARRTQDLLSGPFSLDDVFPEVADLPENLSAAQLQAEFGGVGGEAYRKLLAEIEGRLSRCAALH